MKINSLMHERLRSWADARGEGEIRILDPRLTTPNDGGQCVASFECGGQKYIYKPRSCATDRVWAEFMDAIEPVLGVPMPGTVYPLPPFSEEYTIVPCIENHEFSSEEELIDFYRRCGTLLALCMFLGSRDLHGDNLIADGGKPYLIDVELMLSGIVCNKAEDAPDLVHSLLNCHLLPHWSLDSDGDNIDRGGLSAYDDNLPRLWALPFPPYLYIDTIADSFLEACRAILKNREFLSGELDRFAPVPFRKILRSNHFYRRFYRQLEQIPDEAEKLESAQRLRRAYLKGPPGFEEMMRRACESEIRAVLRSELPTFFSYGSDHCLRDARGVVADGYFVYSAVEAARLRLNTMTWEDCEIQARILCQSLRCIHPEITSIPVSDAMQVFDLLEERAIPGLRSGWLGLVLDRYGEADFGSIGLSLFEGASGVLAFYAALYEATDAERVRDALYRHYQPYREAYIYNEEPLKPTALNLSLTNGIGGHILSLVYFHKCLNDDVFLQDALRLLDRFPFDAFNCEGDRDVYSGMGGLMIVLPALLGCGADEKLRAIAQQLAGAICAAETDQCGFGRGAAGLALALAAAQKVCGVNYEEEILRLLEWESAQYHAETNSWPDATVPGQHIPGHGICSGMPGIGLARMQLMQYAGNPRILEICRRDIERVCAYLKEPILLERDSLCCGNAARMEAAQLLLGGADTCRLNPAPVFFHALESDDFPVGLFTGWAGIGYALARSIPGSQHSLFLPLDSGSNSEKTQNPCNTFTV